MPWIGNSRTLFYLDVFLVEQGTHGIGWSCATGKPELGFFLIDEDLFSLNLDGMIQTYLVDGFAVSGRPHIHDNYAIERTSLCTEFLEPYLDAHGFLLEK